MIDHPRYVPGVELFRAGHYFEAHEELELAWRATPAGDDKRFLQGLIQLAVSLEHWRRGNPRGALGQWTKARTKLDGLPEDYHNVALRSLLSAFDDYYAPHDLPLLVEAQAAGAPRPPPDPRPTPRPEWVVPP